MSKDQSETKTNNSVKMLILGDSYMWDYEIEYEKTFAVIVKNNTDGLEIINTAMLGFGVDQMYLSLVHWGLEEKPECVIMGIYTDDFYRSFRNHGLTFKPVLKQTGNGLVQKSSDEKPGKIFSYLERKSKIVDLYRDGDEWIGRNYGFGRWWNFNKIFLDKIIALCSENNIPLFIIHIPYYTGNPFPFYSIIWPQKIKKLNILI